MVKLKEYRARLYIHLISIHLLALSMELFMPLRLCSWKSRLRPATSACAR